MKRKALNSLLPAWICISIFLGLLSVTPKAQAADWITEDDSGIHVTTDFYKADSNSTGELTFKFPNNTVVGSGFKYVYRENLTKVNSIPNYNLNSHNLAGPLNWTANPLGSGHAFKWNDTDARSGNCMQLIQGGTSGFSYLRSDKIYFSSKDAFFRLYMYAKANTTASLGSWQLRFETYSSTDEALRDLMLKVGTFFTTSYAPYESLLFTRTTNKEAYGRIAIYLPDNGVKRKIFIDDLYLEKWSTTELANSGATTTSYSLTSATAAKITNTITSAKSVSVTRNYYIDQKSPLIKAEAVVTYPATSSIAEEVMRFSVNSKTGWMTLAENLNWVDMNTENSTTWNQPKLFRNYADKDTPKIAFFNNEFSFLGADNMGWWFEPNPSATQTTVEYIIDSFWAHYYVDREDYPLMCNNTAQSFKRHTGETSTFYTYFSIGTVIDRDKYPIWMRQPYGYLSTLIITDHTDTNRITNMKALMFGASNRTSVVNGSGFLGYRLPCTVTAWTNSTGTVTALGFNNATWYSLFQTAYARGWEIAPHNLLDTEPPYATNASTDAMLNILDYFHAMTWIDHGGIRTNLHNRGFNISDSENCYIGAQLQARGYKFSWDWIDLTTDSNEYSLQSYGESPPFPTLLREHNYLPWLYEFSTQRPGSTMDRVISRMEVLLSDVALTALINQRGYLISHQYLSAENGDDAYNFKTVGSVIMLKDTVTLRLHALADKMYNTKEIWATTINKALPYLLTLRNTKVLPDFSGTDSYNIISTEAISGLTLNFPQNIASANIDGQPVAGIKSTRLWLGKLAAGTHSLSVKFGTLSTDYPFIYSTTAPIIYASLSGETMTVHIESAYSGETTQTVVYTSDKGIPLGVEEAVSWTYNSDTKTVTFSVGHSSPVDVGITWISPEYTVSQSQHYARESSFEDGTARTGKTTTNTYADSGTNTETLTTKEVADNTTNDSTTLAERSAETSSLQRAETFPMSTVDRANSHLGIGVALAFLWKKRKCRRS